MRRSLAVGVAVIAAAPLGTSANAICPLFAIGGRVFCSTDNQLWSASY